MEWDGEKSGERDKMRIKRIEKGRKSNKNYNDLLAKQSESKLQNT